jgi:hypothetical protein
MRENHRNPLMHPEDTLELADAIALFNIVQSIVKVVYDDMKERKIL